MSNKARNTSGKFAPKSETPRKIRSVNLTDDAWQWLADVAAQAGVSRNDYLEAMAEGDTPLMETAKLQTLPLIETVESKDEEIAQQPDSDISPLMETVNHALTTPEEALAHAAIFGFTPEEALADTHFQINMLTANYDELEDRYEVGKREKRKLEAENQSLRQELEATQAENEKLKQDWEWLRESTDNVVEKHQICVNTLENSLSETRANYAALLESSTVVTNKLRQELAEARSQLATERADREELDAEFADLAQLKKEVKEHAAELHREQRATELEKTRWQQELSDARCELADAKATMLKQSDKIRELERGYSLKPNPAESRLRLEIGELNQQLSDLKQKSATVGEPNQILFPDLKVVYEVYKQEKKKEGKPGRTFNITELKPFYAAMLKLLTP